MIEGVIKNALLLEGKKIDIGIKNGTISNISSSISGEIIFDAKGNLVIPGLVDLHTHLREPGREDSETVATGEMSAEAQAQLTAKLKDEAKTAIDNAAAQNSGFLAPGIANSASATTNVKIGRAHV